MNPLSPTDIALVLSLLIAATIAIAYVKARRDWDRKTSELEKELATSQSSLCDVVSSMNDAQLRVRTIADSVPVLISYVDKDHRFQFNNKTYEEWFGAEPGAFIGMHMRDAIGVEAYEGILDRVEAALRGEEQTFENEMQNRELGLRYIQARYVPDNDERGNTRGFYSAITDLTDSKRVEQEKLELEKQLLRSQRLKTIGTLAGGIAHDFNNILTPILGYTDLALLNVPESDPLHEDLQRILRGTHRAKDLVEQILLFSKQMEKERKPMSLGAIVSEAMKLLRPSIPSTVRIEMQIDRGCPKVVADASQIHQVVVNLCANAWQAMQSKGGCLTLGLQAVRFDPNSQNRPDQLPLGDFIRLSVSDTGTGMSKEYLDRIFEPFFTTKYKEEEGTGLGLPVVKGIVAAHGGAIDVESELGEGSTFHVYLPVAHSETKANLPSDSSIEGGQETLLIVDDEEAITILLKKMLERYGYVVEAFSDNLAALEACESAPDKYDLVITDLTMPRLTGLDLSKRIIEIRPNKPIIITTGFSNQLAEVDLDEYNIHQVLDKPVMMKELAAAVRGALEKTSAPQPIA